MWKVWDKKSDINGFSAEYTFTSFQQLKNEETIYIKMVGDKATQIEGKSIIADLYGIDPALPDEEFLAEYRQLIGETGEEPPEEIPEEEEPDTTTYAELAQVYAEGVNSIE